MTQVTEPQLFELLGRLFAEVKALTAENEVLKATLANERAAKVQEGGT